MKAIVVGGGLAGLGAAYRLHKTGWDVVVLEADEEVGGRAKTIELNGYSISTGATQVSTSYHDYIALCEDLGVGSEFVAGSNVVSLIRDGKLYEIDGTKPLTVALTGALSLRSKFLIARSMLKMRALKPKLTPLDISANHAVDDGRTAYDFAMQNMNRESFDVIVDPLLRAWTLNRGSEVSALEWFTVLSTLGGVEFITLRGGVQRLSKLIASHVDTRTNARATEVRKIPGGVEVNYTQDGVLQTLTGDACVLATRLPEAVAVSEDMAEVAKPLASRLKYNRGHLVHLGYTVRPKTRSVGIMIPTIENPNVALIWLEHNKGEDDVTPPGHGLFTVYFDEAALDEMGSSSDEKCAEVATSYLEKLIPELKGHQDMMKVSRWNLAIPNPTPGHYRAVHEMKGRIDAASPIQLAGDYFTTTGQNSAIHWGQKAADNIIKHVGRKNAPAEALNELG